MYCKAYLKIHNRVFWKGKKSILEVLFAAKNFVINHATLTAPVPCALL